MTQIQNYATCPRCGGKSIKLNWRIINSRILPPPFACRDCDAQLNGKFTWKVLLEIPVCLVMCYFGLLFYSWFENLLRFKVAAPAFILTVLLIAVAGILILGIWYVSIKVAMRGIIYSEAGRCF